MERTTLTKSPSSLTWCPLTILITSFRISPILIFPNANVPTLHPKHQMLHPQRENLLIDHRRGLPTPLYHQVARFVAVELGDGFEEVEEILAVGVVEFGDEACVDEDELRPVAFAVEGCEGGCPGFFVVAVWAQAGEDFFCDVLVVVDVLYC